MSRRVEFALAEAAAIDEQKIVDIDAFLLDRGRERTHRARRRSADIGVMAARGGPEQDRLAALVEDRRADRDVGQMGAAVVGGVERKHVARTDAPLIVADDRLDRAIHRAQMHRHVRRIGDEASLAIEHGAGKIEPLLDVHGIGGVLERHAHLLGDRHEEMVEDLEHDRVGFRSDRLAARHGLDAPHQDMVFRRDLGAPARFDDDRLMRFDDKRRPIGDGADGKRLARKDVRLSPGPMRKETRRTRLNGRRGRWRWMRALRQPRRPADRLDGHRLDGDRLVSVDEAEAALVRAFERAPHDRRRRERNLDRRVRPRIAQLRAAMDLDRVARDPLPFDLGDRRHRKLDLRWRRPERARRCAAARRPLARAARRCRRGPCRRRRAATRRDG